MSPAPRILVAGIGNIFFGDDGFGVEVVRRLTERAWPSSVKVVDFGIRGLDLTYALLEGYDAAILVDATARGGAPGTLYVIEPEVDGSANQAMVSLEAHALDPARVLATVRAMGGMLDGLRLVGCEPERLGDGDDIAVGLSASVAAAIEPARVLVEELVEDLLRGAHA